MNSREILDFWIKVNKLFELNCSEMDLIWRKRKRILDTRLIVIFIFKIILSNNKRGYGSTIWQLWNSCNIKNIELPQFNSIAASSLCEARQKLPESIFTILNSQLIMLRNQTHTISLWNGHKVFAVDGSKLNMPTGLLNYGFKISKNSGRHYPNGMMSCLYNLHDQLVYDFELVEHNDERTCAINHFKALEPNDLVIFDRGYFSYFMFYKILKSNLNAVFRIQVGKGNVNGKIQDFVNSNSNDSVIEYYPSPPVKHEIKKRGHEINFEPISMRLIKYEVNNQIYVCATTLMNQDKYPTKSFSYLYHSRWGIEELYKISKTYINVEEFHSQTLRTVKQELYAHLLLINIARIFESDSNHENFVKKEESKQAFKVENNKHKTSFKLNFKNCLATLGNFIEDLILAKTSSIKNWLSRHMKAVAKLKQKIRPHRSYPRVSFKPRNSWTAFGKTNGA